jgi:hypothetical protein
VNVCTACGLDFTGVRDFDMHRVGVHAYTYSDGLRMEPMREDGRRCLDGSELEAAGWFRDRHGRWSHPSRRQAQKRSYALRQSRQDATKGDGSTSGHPKARRAA